jgi:hypothetical protein
MGWKNVKNHYDINNHTVHVVDNKICIGSSLCSQIIVIDGNGQFVKRLQSLNNEDLVRYQRQMNADMDMLHKLIQEEDQFDEAITVYTHSNGVVLEKKCEQLGHLNVTHDGCLMYDNRFSTDIDEVIEWAKKATERNIRNFKEYVADAEKKLRDLREILASDEKALADLNNLSR